MRHFFQKKEETSVFFTGEGEQIERPTEIRFDPLTGETSRIVFDPGMAFHIPDYTEAVQQTSGKNCPFCPENVYKMTPTFPEEVAEDGRISQGEAIVAPNLFPYSKHNGVVVMTREHFLRLEDFSVEQIKNAFVAAQTYVKSVLAQDHHESFVSINWNYLPFSGGSILHPHLHVIVSETATNEQQLIAHHNQSFHDRYGEHYFEYLYKHEFSEKERWIGEHGEVAWMHAFAPKSHNDYLAVFRNRSNIEDVTETDWEHFATGLTQIFACLTEQGMASFNLSLTFHHDGSPAYARLIPRLNLGNIGTSDINFFQALHHEPLSYKKPEAIAELARQYF
ncbi:hypothetical protein JNUCC1_02842 [Lentibacillus sp. JNUCC-1]|uniref:hypothetical protein n=1 Tax=Lentibacillus sp. JNUCC-1 TaxID=2654513 RepID=UPI001325ECFE|nr:hypothetical protein [Lentibacillus sp. JNUCC-1]